LPLSGCDRLGVIHCVQGVAKLREHIQDSFRSEIRVAEPASLIGKFEGDGNFIAEILQEGWVRVAAHPNPTIRQTFNCDVLLRRTLGKGRRKK